MNRQVEEIAKQWKLSFAYTVIRYGGKVKVHVFSGTTPFVGLVMIEEDEHAQTIKVCKQQDDTIPMK